MSPVCKLILKSVFEQKHSDQSLPRAYKPQLVRIQWNICL